MSTLVKFLLDSDNEVFAYFPQLNYNKRLYGTSSKQGYAHTGQHTEISTEYAAECELANIFQYEALKQELEGIGYELKVLNKESKSYIAQFNYFELEVPADVVGDCCHSGHCDDDITNARLLPEVAEALNKLDPEKLAKELKEYGAWNDTELSNHDENLNRILWIACGDIKEGR